MYNESYKKLIESIKKNIRFIDKLNFTKKIIDRVNRFNPDYETEPKHMNLSKEDIEILVSPNKYIQAEDNMYETDKPYQRNGLGFQTDDNSTED